MPVSSTATTAGAPGAGRSQAACKPGTPRSRGRSALPSLPLTGCSHHWLRWRTAGRWAAPAAAARACWARPTRRRGAPSALAQRCGLAAATAGGRSDSCWSRPTGRSRGAPPAGCCARPASSTTRCQRTLSCVPTAARAAVARVGCACPRLLRRTTARAVAPRAADLARDGKAPHTVASAPTECQEPGPVHRGQRIAWSAIIAARRRPAFARRLPPSAPPLRRARDGQRQRPTIAPPLPPPPPVAAGASGTGAAATSTLRAPSTPTRVAVTARLTVSVPAAMAGSSTSAVAAPLKTETMPRSATSDHL